MPENTSADGTCVHIILSTVECGNYFAEPDTIPVFAIFYELFGAGTRLRWRGHGNGRGWVTHVRIDGNPGIRGTRSLLRQDVPRKPLR